MDVTVYHNPGCSKSRATLALLAERGIEPRVIEYLREPPDVQTLAQLADALGGNAGNLLRTGEAEYRQLGLDDPEVSDDRILEAIAGHPHLLQRPLVVYQGRARIGRPPENVLEILP